MKAPAFSPGKFQPVVEVSQRDSGLPAPSDTNFSGLETVVTTTLDVANASARGSGAVLPSVVPNISIGKVLGFLLAAKVLTEQLSYLNSFVRVSGPLRQSPSCLEPIVRAYNYFGHFELNGKTYVTRDPEGQLVYYLFKLRQWASIPLTTLAKNTVNITDDNFDKIDLSFYHIGPSGDVVFGKKKGLKEYVKELAKSILGSTLPVDLVLPIARNALDISTEEGLTAFLRYLRLDAPSIVIPDRNTSTEPTADHKSQMRALFGQEYSADDAVIPLAKFSEVISRSYSLLRIVTQERSYVMKDIQFPKYEGGTPAQLAELADDVLYSEVPLSLDDSTIAVALQTTYGATFRYRSAPNLDRNETLRSLVSQSLIKK